MLKLEFDPNNRPLAAALGAALVQYGNAPATLADKEPTQLTDAERGALYYGYGSDQTPADKEPTQVTDDERAGLYDGCGPEQYAQDKEPIVNGGCMDHDCADQGCPDHYAPAAERTVETVETVEAASDPAPRIDHNQVPFSAEFCANAKEPYYATGARAGQWKKRKGVDEAAYDAWYASARPAAEPKPEGPAAPTAAAFTNDPVAEAASMPTNCGEFVAWVAEMQAAERITQAMVNDAYTACGLAMTDLFPPTPAELVADHVEALYIKLSAVA
jgi:hypothetical protein